MSASEEKERDYRKGILPQREKGSASSVKPVLLEYWIEDHQVNRYFYPIPGWRKHGRYKSKQQALRVIEQHQARGHKLYGPPQGCRWRIDGEEVLAK